MTCYVVLHMYITIRMYLEYDDGSWNVKFYLTRYLCTYIPTQSDAIFGSFTVLISDSLFHVIKA